MLKNGGNDHEMINVFSSLERAENLFLLEEKILSTQ
jgi:hypothetical protein